MSCGEQCTLGKRHDNGANHAPNCQIKVNKTLTKYKKYLRHQWSSRTCNLMRLRKPKKKHIHINCDEFFTAAQCLICRGRVGRVEPSQFEAATPSVKPEKSGWGVEINPPPSYISDNWIGALLVRLHFVSFRRWLFVAKHSADADTHNFVERLAARSGVSAVLTVA
jgi:hypothetical protein